MQDAASALSENLGDTFGGTRAGMGSGGVGRPPGSVTGQSWGRGKVAYPGSPLLLLQEEGPGPTASWDRISHGMSCPEGKRFSRVSAPREALPGASPGAAARGTLPSPEGPSREGRAGATPPGAVPAGLLAPVPPSTR